MRQHEHLAPPHISQIARWAIDMNIALSSLSLYRKEHPVSKQKILRAYEDIHSILHFLNSFTIYFTNRVISYENVYLDRNNPVFKNLAKLMWNKLIMGLTFSKGLSFEAFKTFVFAFQENKDLAKETYNHIQITFLKNQLFQATTVDDVPEELWEAFLRSFKQPPTKDAQGEAFSQKPFSAISQPSTKEEEISYVDTIIRYLQNLEHSRRIMENLRDTSFGEKLYQFIHNLNPTLQKQLLYRTLMGEQLSENLIRTMVNLVGIESLMDVLVHLNEEGRSLPVPVFRVLSCMNFLKPREEDSYEDDEEDRFVVENQKDHIDGLLKCLLDEEDHVVFMGEEYDATMEKLVDFAKDKAIQLKLDNLPNLITKAIVEDHYMSVSSELTKHFPEDEDLASMTARHLNKTFTFFLKQKRLRECYRAISMALPLARRDPKLAIYPFVWNQLETHEHLIESMVSPDVDERVYARMILILLGNTVVPLLLETLQSTHDLGLRSQIVAILCDMKADPSDHLLKNLSPAKPWFFRRNILYIFRKRGGRGAIE